jgi:hypothetical protein
MTETETSTALVLPTTGELVDLTDEKQAAKAYHELQILKGKIAGAERTIKQALVERSRIMGTKTFRIAGVGKVEIKGGSETVYDAEALEASLRALGMPEERISEIVVETVSHKVNAAQAKQAAAANEDYAKAIESAKEVREKIPSVVIS